MCDNSCLKFSVTYSRKFQPKPYENIVFGLSMPVPIDKINLEIPKARENEVKKAFKIVVDLVETEIDKRLQELYARENDKR